MKALLNKLKGSLFILIPIIIIILLSFISLIIDNNIDNQKGISNVKSNDKIVQKINNEDFKEVFKKYLLELRESRASWLSRKEIASWSATILYLSVILFIVKKLKLTRKEKIASIAMLLLLIFTILIMLFIHQQYGQMNNSMASQSAIDKYFYLFTINDSSIVDFDYKIEENEVLPKSLADEIKAQQKFIRQTSIIQRMFLPTIKIYRGLTDKDNKDNRDNKYFPVEIQEGILYNIIIIAFVFLCIFVIFSKKNKKSKTKKNK